MRGGSVGTSVGKVLAIPTCGPDLEFLSTLGRKSHPQHSVPVIPELAGRDRRIMGNS